MKIYFIRHGLTEGNIQKKYIGKTDEPLCTEGIAELREKLADGDYENVVNEASKAGCTIWRSPMLRCAQTAEIIFPGKKNNIESDLRECDFGRFESKNWEELSDDPEYQAWIDSGGTLHFPCGESQAGFRRRCAAAFRRIVSDAKENNFKSLIFIVHGGTIMSVMAEYGAPRRDYFDWQIKNSCGIMCNWDGKCLELTDEF